MSELLKIEPRPTVTPRKRRKPRAYVELTIRPVLAADDSDDETCLVIGAPGSDRLRDNIAAFRRRYPADRYRFIQN